MNQGILIVIEGTDGSGKATQAKRLFKRLEQEKVPCQELDFPRYGKPSAVMVEQYLTGALGDNPDDVNAYAASLFYAVDRYASYKEEWGDFYHKGGVLVSDRYTTSNAVHQGSKLEGTQRRDYLQWLYDLEYNRLALPAPTLVIYLDMPTEITEKMMQVRQQGTHTQGDIHEKDGAYLRRCRESGQAVASDSEWKVIFCGNADGNPRAIEAIEEDIWALVSPLVEGLS